MRSSYLLVISLLLVKCQSKSSNESETKDSLTTKMTIDTIPTALNNDAPLITREVPSTFDVRKLPEFTALINSGANIYADSTFESGVLLQIDSVKPAVINNVSTQRLMSEGDECASYYWYNVTVPGNIKGWVEGTFVMLDDPEFQQSVLINDKDYHMYQLKDAGLGPSDESGLTGCEQFYIPYLFNDDEKKVIFISLSDVSGVYLPDLVASYYGNLALALSDEGAATIASLTSEDSELIMNLDIRLQEGGSSVIVRIKKVGDKLSVSSFDRQEVGEGGGGGE